MIGGKNQKVVGLFYYLFWLGLLDCWRLLDLLGLFGAIGPGWGYLGRQGGRGGLAGVHGKAG